MCGIFGIVIPNNISITERIFSKILRDLFLLSESRGKEASGLSIRSHETLRILKRPEPASLLVKSKEYKDFVHEAIVDNTYNIHKPFAVVGHSRMVTNGSQELHENNQPVIKNGIIGVHNGIVVNDKLLWDRYKTAIQRNYEVDTELILSLFYMFYEENNSILAAFSKVFQEIEGYASLALMFEKWQYLLIGTNNGSMYFFKEPDGLLIFASEELMLKSLSKKHFPHQNGQRPGIQHVAPKNGYLIDIENGECFHVPLYNNDYSNIKLELKESPAKIIERKTAKNTPKPDTRSETKPLSGHVPSLFIKDFERFRQTIQALRRCTKCILPETMPFIEFDEQGVCNYCRAHKKRDHLGKEALEDIIKPYRRNDSRPNIIVMVSGGRDSSYMLYFVREVLNMNPIAYTYDWGMVTDLARRNISRLCGKLRVEHLLISADIPKKRRYIRKNVLAWLKKPHIGVIPLFMAGDKIYFYYAHKLRRELGIELIISGRNPLENTSFKHGFSGVQENYKNTPYAFPVFSKLQVAYFYLVQSLKNSAYFNESIADSLIGYFSAYFLKHHYVFFYDYIPWDENIMLKTLRDYFDWEVATDTDTTWRIGDGTASFYNYIYYTVAGFSEIDTFRSNQIREEMLTREEALKLVNEENQPRYESIKWYLDTIELDFETTIQRINTIPKLYKL